MLSEQILKNGYTIFQDKEKFCFGIDAVVLADFAGKNCLKGKNNILDLCTGTAIIPLLMTTLLPKACFTGLEIQKASSQIAQKNVTQNNLDQKIKIVTGDLKHASSFFKKASFEVITCNPPYMPFTHGNTSPNDEKAIARHEVLCSIKDVISSIDYLLQTHGQFFLIHRPERLQEIFTLMSEHKLEAKKLRFIHPFADQAPNLVLIEGRKNAQKGFVIEPPLVVRNKNKEYTDEIKSIQEQKKAL